MNARPSPIAFACEVLRRLVAEQSRHLTEDGPLVVLVEDIETMASGLALAASALGELPAAVTLRAPMPSPYDAGQPERTPRAAMEPRRPGGRPRLSEDEKRARKQARQREWLARRKAAAAPADPG